VSGLIHNKQSCQTSHCWGALGKCAAVAGDPIEHGCVCRVGMLFLPNNDAAELESRKIAEEAIAEEGLTVVGWRNVPVEPSVVGRLAEISEPRIAQVVVKDTSGHAGEDLERVLFLVRKGIEKRRGQFGAAVSDLYVCSLSRLVRAVCFGCSHVCLH
jgi:glutamate synthase domain-containing protein 1